MPDYGAPHGGSNPGVVLPDGWLDLWRAKKATAALRLFPVGMVGDSIARGSSAGLGLNQHVFGLLMQALVAKYGSAGEGYHAVTDTLFGAFETPAGSAPWPVPCWAFSAGWAQGLLRGIGGFCAYAHANGDTAAATFAGVACDVLCYTDANGGAFSVTVDGQAYDKNGVQGGGAGNPTTLSAAQTGGVKLFSVSGLAAGQHTLVLTNLGTTQLHLHGLMAYNGRGVGVLPLQAGFAGKSMDDLCMDVTIDNVSATYRAKTMQGATVAGSWLAAAPALWLLEVGLNDMQHAPGLAYGRFENWLRRASEAALADGVLLAHVIPLMGAQSGWTNSQYAPGYIERVYKMARAYGNPVFDFNMRWGRGGNFAGGSGTPFVVGGGNNHPNAAGHADMARVLIDALA